VKKNGKNPLYHVSADNIVQEASGYLDLLIKKFKLEPIMQLIQQMVLPLFNQLLSQVRSFAMLEAIKNWFDSIMLRFQALLAGSVAL